MLDHKDLLWVAAQGYIILSIGKVDNAPTNSCEKIKVNSAG